MFLLLVRGRAESSEVTTNFSCQFRPLLITRQNEKEVRKVLKPHPMEGEVSGLSMLGLVDTFLSHVASVFVPTMDDTHIPVEENETKPNETEKNSAEQKQQ